MVAGIALGMTVITANAVLMALSGWFIASMAVSGASGIPFNYFLPAAAIRALAIVRSVGRYGERLVTHEAAFRVLADLRVWLFRCLEPLAPAGLERYSGADVAGRLRSDVDALENLYLRIIAPLAIGGLSILLAVALMSLWSGSAAVALLVFLLLAGVGLPLLAGRLAREPGRRSTVLESDLRVAITEGLQGAEELILLGALPLQTARVNDLSQRLIAEQQRLGRIGALTQAAASAGAGLGVAAVLAVLVRELSHQRGLGPGRPEDLQIRQSPHPIQKVPGHAGEPFPLAAIELFRTASDQDHEQWYKRGREEQHQAGNPLGREDKRQGQRRQQQRQSKMGQKARKVGLQPLHSAGDRLHQRSGLFAGQSGRPQFLEPGIEQSSYPLLDPGCGCNSTPFGKQQQQAPGSRYRRHTKNQREQRAKAGPIHDQLVAGQRQQSGLKHDQNPGAKCPGDRGDKFALHSPDLFQKPRLGS
jgi:hypothetical protein